MIHPFFKAIESHPSLAMHCRMDLTDLPEAYCGKKKLKAILLGADPTNNGIKGEGLLKLDTVFGIGRIEYESRFFFPQKTNLTALGLDKDDLYIQNVCRNYFNAQTSSNSAWEQVAQFWLPYLADEISQLDKELPVLVTAERILKVLIPNAPSAQEIYMIRKEPSLYSTILKRIAYPLYRHPTYYLSVNYPEYRNYLKQRING